MATQGTSAGGLDSTLGSDTEVSASSDPLRPSERQLRTERRRNIAAHFEGAAGASKHRTGTPHFWSMKLGTTSRSNDDFVIVDFNDYRLSYMAKWP